MKHLFKKGYTPWNKGLTYKKKTPVSEEARRNISLAMMGRPSPNKGKKYPYKSRPTAKGRKIWNTGIKGVFIGEKAMNWQGGKTLVKGYNYKKSGRIYAMRKRNANGFHTWEQWQELKKKYGDMCLCCKEVEPFIKLCADHIIPVSKGGSNDISNIQPLCRSCNSKKHAKFYDYRLLVSSENIWVK